MNPQLIEWLRTFEPIRIKARYEYSENLPEPIKYIYSRMKIVNGERFFGLRVNIGSRGEYICFHPDPDYGKYPFSSPGILRSGENLGTMLIERLAKTWGIKPKDLRKWFILMLPEPES